MKAQILEESPVMVSTVEIEEFYRKVGDDVFRYWRFGGEKEWRVQPTAFKDVPIAKLNLTPRN